MLVLYVIQLLFVEQIVFVGITAIQALLSTSIVLGIVLQQLMLVAS